jgi:hypothetical protein
MKATTPALNAPSNTPAWQTSRECQHLLSPSPRELVPLVESQHVETLEIRGGSGTAYQVEVQFIWDDVKRRIVRVVGSIDDGGIRAFVPLTETLLISPP